MSIISVSASEPVNINSTRMLVAGFFIHTVGPQVLFILPAVVQGYVDYLGFDDKQAGFISAAETSGMALGTIALIFLSSRMNWRHLFIMSLGFVVAGNFTSVFYHGYDLFRIFRFLSGIGVGISLSLTFVVIGLTEKHDRNFALMIMITLIYSAILFFILPYIYSFIGMNGLLVYFAVSAFIGLFFVKYLPSNGESNLAVAIGTIDLGWILKVIGLIGFFAYFIAMGAVWAYLFLIATSHGMSEQNVANGFSISQFAGIAGAFMAAIVNIRLGRIMPLTFAIILIVAPLIYLLTPHITISFFIVSICIFYFAQNMSHPYLYGTMAAFDRTGRLTVFAASLQALGYAAGPAIAASIIPGDGNYDRILWFSITLFIACLVMITIPIRIHDGKQRLLYLG